MLLRIASPWLVGVILLLGRIAQAAPVDWPVPRGPSREPVPYQYDPTQWLGVPHAFLDDASACTLYSGVSYLLQADGTVETITHEITRFNSRKAVEKLGEYRNISYDPAYESLVLNEARVLKRDGRVVPVEAKHVQLRDSVTDFQVYDHGKQLVISFPTLETGDCIEVKWTTRGRNPEFHGRFFTRYAFGDDANPVVCDEVRVCLPRTLPVHWAVTGGKLEPHLTEAGDQRIYHWQAVNRAQLPLDDNLPSKEEFRLELSLSTFASWEEVLQWEWTIREGCWECPPALRGIVAEVTKDLRTPAEKARALTFWLRRHIRYVSVGEKHDYTPHPPSMVLENGFGDCKDTSQLLAVMLREAGVLCSLVTLGALDDGQVVPEVPSPWGTHAILLVTIDGRPHWIDTTASLAGWDQLPRADRQRVCYVIDAQGLRLLRTPPLTPDDYRVEQLTTLQIDANGTSHGDRAATYFGLAGMARRNDWFEVPSGERRRLMNAELQDANSRSRLVSFALNEPALADFDQPVAARLTFTVQEHFSPDPDVPTCLEGAITDSTLWSWLLSVNVDYDRTVPLELPAPFESVHRYRVQLPPSWRLERLPNEQFIQSKWGSFRLTILARKDDPQHVDLLYTTRIQESRVEPADLAEFGKFREDVNRVYRTVLTLQPVPATPRKAGFSIFRLPGQSPKP